jgi:hypothetical protein
MQTIFNLSQENFADISKWWPTIEYLADYWDIDLILSAVSTNFSYLFVYADECAWGTLTNNQVAHFQFFFKKKKIYQILLSFVY